jgi:hypothetical protein
VGRHQQRGDASPSGGGGGVDDLTVQRAQGHACGAQFGEDVGERIGGAAKVAEPLDEQQVEVTRSCSAEELAQAGLESQPAANVDGGLGQGPVGSGFDLRGRAWSGR